MQVANCSSDYSFKLQNTLSNIFLVTIAQTLSAVFLQTGVVLTHWSNDLMTLFILQIIKTSIND